MSNITRMPERRPVNQRVGLNISLIMRMRGVSQIELATRLGVTQSSVSRRLTGVSPWEPDELETAAETLSVSVGRFFEELPNLDSNQEPAGFKPIVSLADWRASA